MASRAHLLRSKELHGPPASRSCSLARAPARAVAPALRCSNAPNKQPVCRKHAVSVAGWGPASSSGRRRLAASGPPPLGAARGEPTSSSGRPQAVRQQPAAAERITATEAEQQQQQLYDPLGPALDAGGESAGGEAEAPPPPPPPLPHHSPVLVLQYHLEGQAVEWHVAEPVTTYYLIGCAHVSAASCEDVGTLIHAVRPEVVMVELCPERAPLLEEGVEARAPTPAEAWSLVRAGKANPFSVVYAWLLPKVGAELKVPPGSEFKAAAREAKAVGAKLVLGDRSIRLTMARMWAALSWWERVRLVGSLAGMALRLPSGRQIEGEIERLKQADALALAVDQFGKDFPHILKPLVRERDAYMTAVLRRLAGRARVVVAVVGAGHLQGIREFWCEDIDLQELQRWPAGSKQAPK